MPTNPVAGDGLKRALSKAVKKLEMGPREGRGLTFRLLEVTSTDITVVFGV